MMARGSNAVDWGTRNSLRWKESHGNSIFRSGLSDWSVLSKADGITEAVCCRLPPSLLPLSKLRFLVMLPSTPSMALTYILLKEISDPARLS